MTAHPLASLPPSAPPPASSARRPPPLPVVQVLGEVIAPVDRKRELTPADAAETPASPEHAAAAATKATAKVRAKAKAALAEAPAPLRRVDSRLAWERKWYGDLDGRA